MRRPSLPLAFLAGLASATGFAPLGWLPVTLLAFALLVSLVEKAPTLRRALAIGWWFGLGQFVLGLNWIATAFTYQAAMPAWLGWLAVVLLSLYLAVYPALAAGLAWRGRRRGPVVLLLAAGWVVTEWLRGAMFTGFAWNPVGVVWLDTWVAQAAPLIGTYGLSALTVLAGGALRAAFRRDWRTAALAAAAPLAAMLGALAIPKAIDAGGDAVHVVQPNIDQDQRNLPSYAFEGLVVLARLSPRPAPEAAPRLLLWPEAAVDYYLEEDRAARRALAGLLRPGDVLLTGGTALIRDGAGQVVAARNSLFAMDAAGRLAARYDKAHLVPYGEYLPMRPILSAIGLSRLVPGDLDFLPGPGPLSYGLPGFGKVGVQICYEIIFPGAVIDGRNRPDFLFNPSNDAWFGAWGPPQHLAQARLRAIEEGITVVRSTPNGISAVIDPYGRLVRTVPRHEAGAIDIRLPRAARPTFFSHGGNFLSLLFAALLALTAIAAGRRPR